MSEKIPRVVCLVPSWTETLLAAGVNVVGRTRFCIHPADKISSIPAVGGTKNLDLEKIRELQPDYIVLDRQENTLKMAEALQSKNIPMLISDVQDFKSVIDFLQTLGLSQMALRYQKVFESMKTIDVKKAFWNLIYLKGSHDFQQRKIDYVIWKNPFMVMGQKTFIAENLKLMGICLDRNEKYPVVSEDELKKSFCLFSSEPYPFAENFFELSQDGFQGALVDGEKISWYGIRNLLFLEQCLKESE